MRLGKMVRGAMCLFALLALCGALPLGVAAADPAPKPDLRYVITRLGDQPAVLPPSGPATTGNTVQSFAFSGQGRITVAGEPGALGLALTGDFAQPDRVHMTLTLSDPSSGETIPIEVIVIGTTPYLHLTKDLSPDGKDTWVLVDGQDGLGYLPMANMPNLAGMPPISAQTQTIGDERINGVPTTHMRTTIDATALLGGGAKGTKPSMLTLDVWAGKADNFPRHLTIDGNLAIDTNTLLGDSGRPSRPSDIVSATISFTMDFTNINAPVTISPPATFVKLSDLTGTP